uniref:hypothetical protein n=1 Tax=Pseudomonas sp. Z13 TaxID=2983409 RepID=UPI002E819336
MLAKVVNDDVGILIQRGALRFFASKPAPTEKKQSHRARSSCRAPARLRAFDLDLLLILILILILGAPLTTMAASRHGGAGK